MKMTALNLYVSTCRYVLKADPNDQSTWSELYRFIPYLRQIFACSVCGKILQNPKCPSHNVCQHHVCAGCLGGKMRIKPQCSWCRDTAVFVDSSTVRIMIMCFRKLCDYIFNSPIGVQLLSESSNSKANSSERTNLLSVILEVREFKDDFSFPEVNPSFLFPPVINPCPVSFKKGKSPKKTHLTNIKTNLNNAKVGTPSPSPPVLTRFDNELSVKIDDNDEEEQEEASTSIGIENKTEVEESSPIDVVTVSPVENNSLTLLPVMDSGPPCLQKIGPSVQKKHRPKVRNFRPMLKNGSRKGQFKKISDIYNKKNKAKVISFEPPCKRTRTANNSDIPSRKICKCARNNKPNRLTCLGQRCPCYSEKRACVGCLCRGCRNPRQETEHPDSLEVDTTFKDSGFSLEVCNRN